MKLHRFGLIASAIVAFAFCANAQLLWKISGNGLNKPSFLIGTHHIAPTSLLDSIAGFDTAINQCDVVYGEIEKSGLTGQDVQQKMLAKITAPADSTLSAVLDAKTYAAADSLFKAYTGGMLGINQLEGMCPAFTETQLTVLITMTQFPGYNPNDQIDITIQSKAAELGKATDGFETADFQFDLLYGASISEQASDLAKTLANFEKSKTLAKELTEYYIKQDINGLFDLMIKEFEESDYTPEQRQQRFEKMFTNRNKNWVQQLKTIMPKKSAFVVVGAGHLAGEDGVINLLKREGYTVEPMK